MIYRELGSTGIKVSEIGLGCEGFSGKDEAFTNEMFRLAFEHGVNCLDLFSSDPDLRGRIGKALRGKIDRFVIQAHLCTVWQDGQYKCTRNIDEVKTSFESLLEQLETTYVDIGMFHYVDTVNTWREIADGPLMKYALELKAAGKIGHIGISSHNPDAALEAVKSGLIKVLMFSVNPCYDLQPGDEDLEKLWAPESYDKPLLNMNAGRKALYETCQRFGVGITVMKAFGGGDLLADYSPAGKALTVNQCIHYALTRPGVATVLSGARTIEEMRVGLAYESASDAEKDYASAFASLPKISWQGHCMYCGHCAPCSKGIDVAAVTKLLSISKAQGTVPETVREHYAVLPHTAGDCLKCGECEKRCPFNVAVRENMILAKERFGR